jgi:serine/threonine-protein kinase/endoribonuclease IRE1
MASIFHSSTFIILFAAICLAQTVTLHAGLNNAISNGANTAAVATGARYSTRSFFADKKEDVALLDVVLVASVDGRFHALNRTSGQKLWSMSHSTPEAPSSLAPLVRTKHASYDSDLTDDDDPLHEVYVIEPQSGDIYVMATPTSPLQRLSFSMPQLVEMSPFKFARDDDERVFVGKKETSLLSIELETGRVKAINAECPWDPFEDLSHRKDLDLDELEDCTPNKEKFTPTEVFIGRTGGCLLLPYSYYTLTRLHRKTTKYPSSHARIPPMDGRLLYRTCLSPHMVPITRTMSCKLRTGRRKTAHTSILYQLARWFHSKPMRMILQTHTLCRKHTLCGRTTLIVPCERTCICHQNASNLSYRVAVFDVLSSSQRSDPFALLQPRPDLLRGSDVSSLDMNTGYVGLVEETKSLYVMGVDHFPLTAFGDTEFNHKLVESVDGLTKRRKLSELCDRDPGDPRCLTGKRHLDSSLNNKQLPGVPGAMLPPVVDQDGGSNLPIDDVEALPTLSDPRDNTSMSIPWMPWSGTSSSAHATAIGPTSPISAIGSILLATAFVAGFIFRSKLPHVRLQVPAAVHVSSTLDGKADGDTVTSPPRSDTPVIPTMDIPPVLSNPAPVTINSELMLSPDDLAIDVLQPNIRFDEPARPNTPAAGTLDIGDAEESDRENATPKKRKGPRRGRRGKKGKGTGGAVNGMGDELDDKDANGHVPEAVVNTNTPLPTLVVPQMQHAATSSLVVSETILGEL